MNTFQMATKGHPPRSSVRPPATGRTPPSAPNGSARRRRQAQRLQPLDRRLLHALVADVHPLVGHAIGLTSKRVAVDWTATNSRDLFTLLADPRCTPDVVVVDLRLPGAPLDLIRRISSNGTQRRVCVVADAPLPVVQDALAQGAAGFARKQAPVEDIVACVERVAGGDVRSYDPRLAGELIAAMSQERRDDLPVEEVALLRLLASGATNAQIAATLGYSVDHTKTLLGRLYRHLGATDRLSAVVQAARAGYPL